MKMINPRSVLTAVALAGFTCTSAFADTVSSTDNLTTPFGSGAEQTINVESFDAALTDAGLNPSQYTLTGVTFGYTESSVANVTAYNITGGAATFEGATQALNPSVSFDINGLAASTTNSGPLYNGTLSELPGGGLSVTSYGVTNQPVNTAAFSTTVVGPSSPSASVTAGGTYNVAAADLGEYGSSTPSLGITFNAGAMDDGGSQQSGSAFIAFGGSTSTTAGVTVTYSFDDAPEPSTWALMLAALGGLVMVQRLRRLNA